MLKVRKNIFETNSSSTHSLIFSKKNRGYDFDLPVDENGLLEIPFREFGWGPDVLTTPLEKLSYYITDNTPTWVDENEKPWEQLLEEILKTDTFQDLIEMIKNNCSQVKEIKFVENTDDYYYPFGYVDHESVGTSRSENITPYELIFNNDVAIVIDNDNSDFFSAYFPFGDMPVSDIEDLFNNDKEWYR